ncbi:MULTISPECIES: DUF1003 domain-containing protein [unclassified Streptomyces]|uniref:DUF1003 domain-containing protein n=1 Tax=unclassified Streptomyces TaxID=2593676 RepID=UPI002250943D|nr:MULTISPECIES: DUF1003 domain-containing protein [unclassified Streptomyces]MCX5054332.1 DUF1003 domain-containing protein [Streptomyces sp. NBC_00474]MCX5062856.1 DUF1003 domain-containing protein [Streptomyces sp. NBC_00452]MCX5250535.1 DUF1003 domain-containing protein [Streptomyces sp. NBC_00201]MCX5291537.1 DUF1003 domain-containing protein [Streptomyces sp. NBC_00183]
MGAKANRSGVRIMHEEALFARIRGTQDRIADGITAFAGTMQFVYLHALWFAVWIVCNEGVFGDGAVWDPYPFGLLTMIVSLEAIFLSTFVMVSQNRQAARENVRADLDFETNVRSEVWSIHMGRALGVDPAEVERRVQELLTENRALMNGTARPSD